MVALYSLGPRSPGFVICFGEVNGCVDIAPDAKIVDFDPGDGRVVTPDHGTTPLISVNGE